ncbi:MAG TPA: peptidoglycan-associated lipoprotein Pal [Candidatus Udaeobacter sp.]|nr:peptidoglycan-associated lipoprotein Pal [Candidatus Udaeobacter sp.]
MRLSMNVIIPIAALAVIASAGCGGKKEPAEVAAPPAPPVEAPPPVAPPPPTQPPAPVEVALVLDRIYFDFDRADLREDARTVLAENARRMQGKAGSRVSIEGHCDERGTVEYNLALGEKRAAAAKDYLVNYGITADRVSTVSFGEERPLDPSGTEEAYAKNRRDEFIVQ